MDPQSRDTQGRGNSEACLMSMHGFPQASSACHIIFVPYAVHCLHELPSKKIHWGLLGAEEGGGRQSGSR